MKSQQIGDVTYESDAATVTAPAYAAPVVSPGALPATSTVAPAAAVPAASAVVAPAMTPAVVPATAFKVVPAAAPAAEPEAAVQEAVPSVQPTALPDTGGVSIHALAGPVVGVLLACCWFLARFVDPPEVRLLDDAMWAEPPLEVPPFSLPA